MIKNSSKSVNHQALLQQLMELEFLVGSLSKMSLQFEEGKLASLNEELQSVKTQI